MAWFLGIQNGPGLNLKDAKAPKKMVDEDRDEMGSVSSMRQIFISPAWY
jgi:hypothetical protein